MNKRVIEELEGLLTEALDCLRSLDNSHEQLSLEQFRMILQKCRSVYSPIERHIARRQNLEVVSPKIKQKLLAFLNRELADYIVDGKIQSASVAISSGILPGAPVENVLRNLLVRAVVDGPKQAALAFAACNTGLTCRFHRYFLIGGITVSKPIEIFKGMTLVPLPKSVSALPPHLPEISRDSSRFFPNSIDDLLGMTLVCVEYEVSPIFQKPLVNFTLNSGLEDFFDIKLKGEELLNFNLDVICNALSLVARRRVMVLMTWSSLLPYEVFDLSSSLGVGANGYTSFDVGNHMDEPVPLGQAQLGKVRTICRGLTELPSETWERLRIPIDRWAKSMAEENPIDQIIDLGIAIESLYVPDSNTEVSFRLAVHAAWHLGQNEQNRRELVDQFKQIYQARSQAVHTGKLRGKMGKPSFNVQDLVIRAQNLCWQGINKVIDVGEYPDWKKLIMGEETG